MRSARWFLLAAMVFVALSNSIVEPAHSALRLFPANSAADKSSLPVNQMFARGIDLARNVVGVREKVLTHDLRSPSPPV